MSTWAIQKDISKFINENEKFLLEHEAENNMLLQAISRAVQTPSEKTAGFRDGNDSLAILYNGSLIFNESENLPADGLVEAVLSFDGAHTVSKIMGPDNIARDFTRRWTQANKAIRIEKEFTMILQKLDEVKPIQRPAGQFRRAWIEEADLLATWLEGFIEDTGVGNDSGLSYKEMALDMIHSKRLFVWGNNRPAAMVGMGGSTPKGIRVHSVYTPPDKRGKGFAKAAVASLSELQLSQGKEFLVLYVDATRPENSALYNQIGYKPVANHMTYFLSSK